MQLFFASKQAGCDGNLLSLPRERWMAPIRSEKERKLR